MPRRVAITGAAGQLGRPLVQIFADAGDEVLALARPDFDLTRAEDLKRLSDARPDVVVNAAACTDVDACALDPELARRINGHAAGAVAAAAASAGALVVQVSTNEVFDGALERPYVEGDEPRPLNAYGASKLVGEQLVAAANPRHLVVRTAWLYGGETSFPTKIRAAADRMLAEGSALRVVDDEWGNPTHVEWLARAIERVASMSLSDGHLDGTLHVAGWPPTTRFQWASQILAGHGVRLEPMPGREYVRASRVPPRAILDVSMASGRGIAPGDWRSAAGA